MAEQLLAQSLDPTLPNGACRTRVMFHPPSRDHHRELAGLDKSILTGHYALVIRPGRSRVVSWPPDVLVALDGAELTKVDEVGISAATEMLREGCRSVAVIDLGEVPRWSLGDDALAIWKNEIRDHLIEPGQPGFLDGFPDGYFYDGSRWAADHGNHSALVFFKNH